MTPPAGAGVFVLGSLDTVWSYDSLDVDGGPQVVDDDTLQLSLSQAYDLRLSGIRYNLAGQPTDPRSLFTAEFQLLAPGSAAFGSWTNGSWDAGSPATGPYASRITVGAGQPAPVNPATAGLYRLWVRYAPVGGSGETPTFAVGMVNLSAP